MGTITDFPITTKTLDLHTEGAVLYLPQILDDAQKLQARTNIGAGTGTGTGGPTDAVLYTPQTLDTGQQAQARLNIGVTESGSPLTGAVRYDAVQTLTQVEKQRARLNVGITRTFTPYDFDAVGDGIADDTTPMQNFWAAGGAGVLLTGTGIFRITATIIINNPRVTFKAGGFFKIVDDDITKTNSVQVQNGADDVWIQGLEIDYNKVIKTTAPQAPLINDIYQNSYCLAVRGSRPTIIDCVFRNAIEHGLSVRKFDEFASDLMDSPRVISCKAFDCGNTMSGRGVGIWVFGNVRNSFIHGCVVKNCVGGGIGVDDGSTGSGSVNRHYNTIITDNDLHGGSAGIRYEGTRYAVIAGNTVNNYYNGMVPFEQHCAISLRSVEQTGNIHPSGDMVVTGNRLFSTICGIDMLNMQDTVISGNDIEMVNDGTGGTAELAAIKCMAQTKAITAGGTPRNLLIKGNNIRSNKKGIAFAVWGGAAPPSDYVRIPGVTITDNNITWIGVAPAPSSMYGIDLDFCEKPIVSDNQIRGFYRGAFMQGSNSGPLIYRDNDVIGCVQYGHHFGGNYHKIITGNTASDTVGGGFDFRFEDSARDNASTIWRDNHGTTFSNCPNANSQLERLNRNQASQVYSGGTEIVPLDLGASAALSGTPKTLTVDVSLRDQQILDNSIAFTLAPGAKKGATILTIINIASAGVITDATFTTKSGDTFTTTVGHAWDCFINITEGGSHIHRVKVA